MTSLCRYQGIVREWVLRAKVGGDHRALGLIEEALATSSAAQRAIQASDGIMACPSSLWGRWHGRLDIPGCAAVRLAVEARKPLLPAPPSQFWRWRKQALSHGVKSAAEAQSWLGPNPQQQARRWTSRMQRLGSPADMRILLIDDVVTTGKTLDRLTTELAAHGYRATGALTFAAAPHFCLERAGSDLAESDCNQPR